MQFRKHRLDNGLEILAEINPSAHAIACGFFVRTGARDETPDIGGVSHFLEHMVFKGTPNRSAEQVNQELDEMGSHSNARTGEESTIYHATVLPDFQTPVVELMADILRPSLRDDDFETEKQVIIEEIKMYDDQPPYGGYERVMAEYFGDHPLGQSVLGTVQTVTDLTPEKMHRYFDKRYSADNIGFAIAGNVNFEQLFDDLNRCCGDWNSFNAKRDSRRATPRSGFVTIHKPEATQQYILQLAAGPSTQDDDRYASRVLSTILGDDSGSRFYWEFIDSGLAESAGVGNQEYDNAGLTMTFLCCAPEQAQENIDRAARLQSELLTSPVTDRELELAKSKITSQIILASERTESRMFSVGSQWLRGHQFKTPREIADIYASITLDQIIEVSRKYPLTQNMTVCVGPLEQLRAADG
jgi:predicted Zn-dependent peptidase